MKLPAFEYKAPTSLREAVSLLASADESARPLAGGQSLLPIMAFRLAHPSLLVDLGRIPGLASIEVNEAGLRLGAMTRWRDLEDDAGVASACPLLAAALAHIAHYQIRNRGTIGGSLAHADPAAELPTIALTCEARLDVIGASGSRSLDARDLFVGPLMNSLRNDEIIVTVQFPPWPNARRWAFEEFARRRGDFAVAGVALFYDEDGGRARNAHIGAIGVGDTPLRLGGAESALNGRHVDEATIASVASIAHDEVNPPSDIHGSSAYRKGLVATLLQRALSRAAGRS